MASVLCTYTICRRRFGASNPSHNKCSSQLQQCWGNGCHAPKGVLFSKKAAGSTRAQKVMVVKRGPRLTQWRSIALPLGLYGGTLPFRTGDLSSLHAARLDLSFFIPGGVSSRSVPRLLFQQTVPQCTGNKTCLWSRDNQSSRCSRLCACCTAPSDQIRGEVYLTQHTTGSISRGGSDSREFTMQQ
eukprot:1160479-Pelagomonas_calceolata.AAC.14